MKPVATPADKDSLDVLVRTLYSLQKLRIQTGNRIVASAKVTLGQEPEMSEDDLSPKAKAVLEDLRRSHKSITAAFTSDIKLRRDFKTEGLITGYAQYCLIGEYLRMEESEKAHERVLRIEVEKFPIWREFLKDVPGCGPVMAAVIITRLDPHKAKYVSSFWKFAGLDVGPDGRGRGKYKEHLVPRSYTNARGEERNTVGITFDPFLKTKLLAVLGASMLKAAAVTKHGTLKYDEAYRNYRHRLDNHPLHKGKTKVHKHRMALRVMVKLFLQDLYATWRALEGLPVHPPYAEGKLGISHDQDIVQRTLYPNQTALQESLSNVAE